MKISFSNFTQSTGTITFNTAVSKLSLQFVSRDHNAQGNIHNNDNSQSYTMPG